MPSGSGSAARVWPLLLLALFVLSLFASWQRWSDPIVDVGREMSQPLRLAEGETLYSDVRHIYGPFSPVFHAALYRLFGPSLTILYIDGILCAAIVLAIVYWLGCLIMRPAASAAAALNVMALCVFKPSGNYLLPYSYNALHGEVFALVALAAAVAGILRAETAGRSYGERRWLVLAGTATGLAILAKTEMGAAALAAVLTAAWIGRAASGKRTTNSEQRRGGDQRAGMAAGERASTWVGGKAKSGIGAAVWVLAPAAAVTVAGYGLAIWKAGWSAVLTDSWLLLTNMPAALLHYNAQVSGLADPWRSVERMLIAAGKVAALAFLIAGVSHLAVSRRRRQNAVTPAPEDAPGTFSLRTTGWRLLAVAALLVTVMALTSGFDRDKGPFLAMPLLLAGLLVSLRVRPSAHPRPHVLIVMAVFAIASLGRMILHVRSGGAYASFLLPVSIVLFTYLWVGPFIQAFRSPAAARLASRIVVILILLAGLGNSAVLAYRARTRNTVPVGTARGTVIAEPDMGVALNEALAFIDRHTRPGDPIVVLPEGTMLTFLSGRRNPLREEIVTPGYLDGPGEARAIEQLESAPPALVLVPNRPTREFGAAVLGRDYDRALMRWIEDRYSVCTVFGPVHDTSLEIGDPRYFIRAYCPRE